LKLKINFKSVINKNIFLLHSWLGLIIGIFILIFSLSGSITIFGKEIDNLQYPNLYYVKYDNKKPLDLDNVYKIVSDKYKNHSINSIKPPLNLNQSLEFGMQDNNSNYYSLFVNPYDGSILGEKRSSIHQFFLDLHYKFRLGKIGEFLSAIFSILLIISSLTGLFIYRKSILKTLKFKTKIRTNNLKEFSIDVHNFFGVWLILFILVVSTSGFIMMKYALDFKNQFNYQKVEFIKSVKPKISIDKSIKTAKNNLPNLEINYISLPSKGYEYLNISGDVSGNWWIGEYYNNIKFDSNTGEILKVAKENDLTFSDKFVNTIHTFHFGRYGGLTVKIIESMLGLILSSIVITGFYLKLKKHLVKNINPI